MNVVVSGGFDPVHPGHLAMFEAAAGFGPVTAVINSDAWLIRKKGFVFQPWADRSRILRALRTVSNVAAVDDADGTVVEALDRLRPRYFANGGDRGKTNTPELDACRRLGIVPLFGIGGADKAASSSAIATSSRVVRTWGAYEVLGEGPSWKVKRLIVGAGQRSSVQRHACRAEIWVYPDGAHRHIPAGCWHQLENDGAEPLEIVEVQIGDCREEDIERR